MEIPTYFQEASHMEIAVYIIIAIFATVLIVLGTCVVWRSGHRGYGAGTAIGVGMFIIGTVTALSLWSVLN